MSDNRVKNNDEDSVEPFYRTISGSILQLGIFESEDDSYQAAKLRTKPFLASHLDLETGCRVVSMNLVHVQNRFSVRRNSENLPRYYQKRAEYLEAHREQLDAAAGSGYIDYTIQALNLWARTGSENRLGLATFLARKP